MPYMQYLFCEKCGTGANLDVDFHGTIEAYLKDGRPNPSMNPATLIWDYMLYRCTNCGAQFKYTYRDVELSVRNYLSSVSQKFKAYLEELDEYNKTEESRRSGHFFAIIDPDLRKRLRRTYVKED